MPDYPQLSEEWQRILPALNKPATAIIAKFEDSTHALWHCDTVAGPMVLKVCNQAGVMQSSFWQVMNQLFDCDFPNSLQLIEKTHQFLAEYSLLKTPRYQASAASAFVLAEWLPGQDVELNNVNEQLVRELACHISQLHRQTCQLWGALHQPELKAMEWASRLSTVLRQFSSESVNSIPEVLLHSALQQLEHLPSSRFVPVMADLRWDQFRHQNGQLSAVVDLDAFVYAPAEFELVILEYQLSQQQADIFKTEYEKTRPFPELSEVRKAYRLLFFLMNALGETDIERWMAAPEKF